MLALRVCSRETTYYTEVSRFAECIESSMQTTQQVPRAVKHKICSQVSKFSSRHAPT